MMFRLHLGPLSLTLLALLNLSAHHMSVVTAGSIPPAPSLRDIRHHDKDTHTMPSAQDITAQLGLVANVEKGYYIQTFEDPDRNCANRSASTAIYYLLEGSSGQSYWHRVIDAAEVWHHYAGAPLILSLSYNDGSPIRAKVLGMDISKGQRPQVVVAKNEWQSATSLGEWTLVGTTVAPGFLAGPNSYELAPPGWQPNGA